MNRGHTMPILTKKCIPHISLELFYLIYKNIDESNKKDFLKSLLVLQKDFNILSRINRSSPEGTQTLFREDSLSTYLISIFFEVYCSQYLNTILSRIIIDIEEKKNKFFRKKNISSREISFIILKVVLKSVDFIPQILLDFFATLESHSISTFSNLFFLRLLQPFLLEHSKHIPLLSIKILNSLVNGVVSNDIEINNNYQLCLRLKLFLLYLKTNRTETSFLIYPQKTQTNVINNYDLQLYIKNMYHEEELYQKLLNILQTLPNDVKENYSLIEFMKHIC